MNKKIVLPISIALGVILLGGGAYALNKNSNNETTQPVTKIDDQVKETDVIKEVDNTIVEKNQNNSTESEETKKVDGQSAKKEGSNSKVENNQNKTSNSKVENNQNETNTSTDSKKAEYIKELNNLKSSTDKAITGKVQIEMNAQAEDVYKKWDTELNKIWKELELKLSKEEMNNLRQKQNVWIKEKEEKKKQIGEEAGQVTSAPFKVDTALTEMTKERCYYLVNNYM